MSLCGTSDWRFSGIRAVGGARGVPVRGRYMDLVSAYGHARHSHDLIGVIRMRFLAILLLTFLTGPTEVRADGGTFQASQQAGSFVITVFTAPDDISVMIQKRDTMEPVLDAEVSIRLKDSAGERVEAVATRKQAQNKLLYAAPVILPHSGKWNLSLDVAQGGSNASMVCVITVMPASPV